MSEEKVLAYLMRLTGGQSNSPESVQLTSTQKATLASWLRRESIEFNSITLQHGSFSIRALLKAETEGSVANYGPIRSAPSRASLSRVQIGIDLEQISSLPEALDYREHEFYRDNFTPQEIAYCLQRPDVRASLCGLWAAKEAVVKAVGSTKMKAGLRGIEIRHDDDGRPISDGGELSISHSGGFCIAVFAAVTR